MDLTDPSSQLRAHIERALAHAWVTRIITEVIVSKEIMQQYDAWYNKGQPYEPETQALVDCVNALKRAVPFLEDAEKALWARQQMIDEATQQKKHTK